MYLLTMFAPKTANCVFSNTVRDYFAIHDRLQDLSSSKGFIEYNNYNRVFKMVLSQVRKKACSCVIILLHGVCLGFSYMSNS
jgi:hypothetical protein